MKIPVRQSVPVIEENNCTSVKFSVASLRMPSTSTNPATIEQTI
jgi:hypothetical protein